MHNTQTSPLQTFSPQNHAGIDADIQFFLEKIGFDFGN
jgi:hypothetical protein